MNNENNVPKWILNSQTAPTEQNEEVGEIVGGYIGAFRKRGFSQTQIGIFMVSAFLLPLNEVEKRLDAVLSCGKVGEEEQAKNLCAFIASKGHLFAEDADPCEIIELLKNKYGNEAAFETLLTFPELLSVWKKADIRESGKFIKEKKKAEYILQEVASVFPAK